MKKPIDSDSILRLLDILIGFFNNPKKGPDKNPLNTWKEIIRQIGELKKTDRRFENISKDLLKNNEFKHLFEGWASVGYQTSFSIAKRQLEKIRNEIIVINSETMTRKAA